MAAKLCKNVATILLSLAALVCVAAGTGCDQLLGTTGAYLNGWFPATGLYDPTNDIQSVIDYRLDVMEASNDAWDEYIRQ
jgi:hypothetical protein